MRGQIRKISVPRRFVIELMRASIDVPFITLSRTFDVKSVADARAGLNDGPGWAAIFAKAFSLAAKDDPVLRTLYMAWPWPHFFELPRSVGMIAIARKEDGEDCVLSQRVTAADQLPLSDIDALIRHAKTAPADDVPAFRKALRAAALPWLLRRLVWAFGLHVARQRANYFGSFSVTSVSAFGRGELHAVSPGPYVLSYGQVTPDKTMNVVIRWDHRVTDAAKMARTLSRIETILNTAIADELAASRPRPELRTVRAATA